jgi:hypothetical protein
MSAPSPYQFIRVVPDASTKAFTAPGTDRFGTNCTQNCTHFSGNSDGDRPQSRGDVASAETRPAIRQKRTVVDNPTALEVA